MDIDVMDESATDIDAMDIDVVDVDNQPARKRRRTQSGTDMVVSTVTAELDAIHAAILALLRDGPGPGDGVLDGDATAGPTHAVLREQNQRWERAMWQVSAALGPAAYGAFMAAMVSGPTVLIEAREPTIPLESMLAEVDGETLRYLVENAGGEPILLGHPATRPALLLASTQTDGTAVFVVVDPTTDTLDDVPISGIAEYAARSGMHISTKIIMKLRSELVDLIADGQVSLRRPLGDEQQIRLNGLPAPVLLELINQLPEKLPTAAPVVATLTVRIRRGRIETSGSPATIYLYPHG
jgi:hypothetical protein